MAEKRKYRNDSNCHRRLHGFLTLGTHDKSSDVAVLKVLLDDTDDTANARPIWFSMIFLAGVTEKPMPRYHPREVWKKRDGSLQKLFSSAGMDSQLHIDARLQQCSSIGLFMLVVCSIVGPHSPEPLVYMATLQFIWDNSAALLPSYWKTFTLDHAAHRIPVRFGVLDLAAILSSDTTLRSIDFYSWCKERGIFTAASDIASISLAKAVFAVGMYVGRQRYPPPGAVLRLFANLLTFASDCMDETLRNKDRYLDFFKLFLFLVN